MMKIERNGTVNKSILYWKWDSDVLDPKIMAEKVRDLVSRTEIGNIFIGMEWIHEDFQGPGISAAFAQAIRLLHEAGRKVMIECCVRGEGEPFYRENPDEPSYLVTVYEGQADANGVIRVPHEPVWHYWRKTGENGEHRVFHVWRIEKNGAQGYSHGEKLQGFSSHAVKTEDGFEVEITVPGAREGDILAAAVGFPQPIPDLAHPQLIPYFRRMARHAAGLGADGVFSDEWGFDVILKIVQPNPYDDRQLNLRHIPYSKYMEAQYQARYGEDLGEAMLDLYYAGSDRRRELVDRYMRLLREICTQNEEQMYTVVKQELGPDAFWGVHPTWWGSVDKQNFEFFKNGFYWWDAKRDYAQTDEAVAYAIRTALAHRFQSPIWYNMWYSMGTRDIRTYYTESWNNLRCGGRTHYLGYECPNEAVVLDLRPKGLLESIEKMDKRIRLFDGVDSQPDCRVLLFFGFEAVSNWADIGLEIPWKPENPRLMKVLQTADQMFREVLCDLVPSYSVENGSLYINGDGKAQYGNQVYDAVIALYPNGMTEQANRFLRSLDPEKLILCGTEDWKDLGAAVFPDVPPVGNLVAMTDCMNVPRNRWENGCKLQNGSAIFTGDGKLPVGNRLDVHVRLNGKTVDFTGEDALWIRADGSGAIFPAGKLTVDGKTVE